jgi:hypothetical protein
MPIQKERTLWATRQNKIDFTIHVVLYHGQVADTHKIQEQTHLRAEAVEDYLMLDRKWNFVDRSDSSKDKIVHGMVTLVDHPLVIMGTDQLWQSTRLQLEGESRENFDVG